MKTKLILLVAWISGLLLVSCGTPKYITVTEKEYIKDTVKIKADTVRVEIPKEVVVNVVPQLDTLKMETSVAESTAYLDTLTQTLKGSIKNKKTELQKEIQVVEKIKVVEHKVEVPVPVEVVKKKTPRWAWWLLAIDACLLVGFLLKLKFKFRF